MKKEINNFGCIEVICGNMFSGKTEELIRRLVRAQFAKQKVAVAAAGSSVAHARCSHSNFLFER